MSLNCCTPRSKKLGKRGKGNGKCGTTTANHCAEVETSRLSGTLPLGPGVPYCWGARRLPPRDSDDRNPAYSGERQGWRLHGHPWASSWLKGSGLMQNAGGVTPDGKGDSRLHKTPLSTRLKRPRSEYGNSNTPKQETQTPHNRMKNPETAKLRTAH